MKTLKLFTLVPVTLLMVWGFSQVSLAQTPVTQVSANLQPDPLVLSGKSGGKVASNCGNISNTPNQILQVTESLPYLRLTVEGQGKPTLLIDGPGGRFCVLADSYSGGKPEMSGYWQPGRYSLYIGDTSQGQHTYTLTISERQK
jgi:hypothetical protein